MVIARSIWLGLLALFTAVTVVSMPAAAQQQQTKPNILFIMGDDIGWMQPSIYHRGLMVGETPNIDRIGNEGAIFMDYVAMQSCTSGRNAFFTGMYPLRTGMIPPQSFMVSGQFTCTSDDGISLPGPTRSARIPNNHGLCDFSRTRVLWAQL